MKRKVAVIIATIMLVSTGAVYAASVNGTFAGLPIVKVNVNGTAIKSDVPGVVLQGKTLLPARAIAESLDAVVSWDQATMTANIEQPEVEMLFVSEVRDNADSSDYWDIIAPYSWVSAGQDQQVIVFYQVAPLAKQNYEFRIIVKEPDGDILTSSASDSFEVDSKGMSGYLPFDDLDFKTAGNYRFEFQIKYNGEYKTVAHKTMVVE